MTDTRTLAAMLLHLAGLMRVTNPSRFVTSFSVEDVEQMAADVQREPASHGIICRALEFFITVEHQPMRRNEHIAAAKALLSTLTSADVQRAPVPPTPAAMRKAEHG